MSQVFVAVEEEVESVLGRQLEILGYGNYKELEDIVRVSQCLFGDFSNVDLEGLFFLNDAIFLAILEKGFKDFEERGWLQTEQPAFLSVLEGDSHFFKHLSQDVPVVQSYGRGGVLLYGVELFEGVLIVLQFG